jgi:hypothetical protein
MSESLGQKYERILSMCEVGKRHGAFTQIACPCTGNHKHGDKEKSASLGLHSNGISFKCFAGCQTDDFLKVLGLTYKDLFPDDEKIPTNIYTYHNADGSYHHDKVKYRRPDGKKDFRQRTIDENGKVSPTAQVGIPFAYPELNDGIKQGKQVVVCYSPDTELLTLNGWVRFDKLKHNELVAQYHTDNSITFVQPSNYQIYDYDGEIVNIYSEFCDLMVTPDHRIWAHRRKCNSKIYTADNLMDKSGGVLIPVSGYCNTRYSISQPTIDQAKFITAWIADGYKPPRGMYNFNIKKERKKLRLRELLNKLSIRFKEVNYPSCMEWSQFWIKREDVKFLEEYCPDKKWTWDMLKWDFDIRQIMIEELKYWDGDQSGKCGSRLFTAIEEQANIVTCMGVLTGYGSIMRNDDHTGKRTFVVNLNHKIERSIIHKPIRSNYKGKVYCCTVPTSLLVTRRNGKTVVAGNCEGEKDALTGKLLGYVSTTMGGASDWKDEYKNFFKGASVILIPDKDDPGLKHANNVVESLKSVVKSLKMLILPMGKDLTEWVEAGNSDLKSLIDKNAIELVTTKGVPEPVVREICGGYELYWIGLGLKVTVDHIEDDDLAELSIYEKEKPVYISSYRLLSVAHKESLVKALSKINKSFDWFTIVNQITIECLSRIRDGEQVVMLNSEIGAKRPEFLVFPMFVKNNANIIYGDRSSAKSLFIMLVTIMATMTFDAYDLKISGEHTILWLDWENDKYTTGYQKQRILKGFGLENIDIAYLHLSRTLARSVSQIQRKIAELGADIVVIDSLGIAVGGNLNESEPAINFFNALNQLPVTPLIIAHTAKDKNNPRKTVYGNAYYENLARSIWEANKVQENESDQLVLSLFQRKAPPFSGYQKPFGFRFLFDGDKIYVEKCEASQDERTKEHKDER